MSDLENRIQITPLTVNSESTITNKMRVQSPIHACVIVRHGGNWKNPWAWSIQRREVETRATHSSENYAACMTHRTFSMLSGLHTSLFQFLIMFVINGRVSCIARHPSTKHTRVLHVHTNNAQRALLCWIHENTTEYWRRVHEFHVAYKHAAQCECVCAAWIRFIY